MVHSTSFMAKATAATCIKRRHVYSFLCLYMSWHHQLRINNSRTPLTILCNNRAFFDVSPVATAQFARQHNWNIIILHVHANFPRTRITSWYALPSPANILLMSVAVRTVALRRNKNHNKNILAGQGQPNVCARVELNYLPRTQCSSGESPNWDQIIRVAICLSVWMAKKPQWIHVCEWRGLEIVELIVLLLCLLIKRAFDEFIDSGPLPATSGCLSLSLPFSVTLSPLCPPT